MDRLKPGCYLKSKVDTAYLKKGSVYKVESASLKGTLIKLKDIPATYEPTEFTYWGTPIYPRTVRAKEDLRSSLTAGHVYEVRDVEEHKYQVVTNGGHTEWLFKDRFVAPQETVRNSKEALAPPDTFLGVCVDDKDNPVIVLGKTYELKQCPSFPDNYKVYKGGIWYSTLKRRFELINQPKEKQMLPENWKSYSFNIKNTAQIDESLITEDLSWENPLFIMQVEGSDSIQAFVADEVWTKAANSGKVSDKGGWPETKFERKLGKILGDFGEREIPMQDVPKLVKLIQKIKRAKWNGSQKRRVTVKRVQV